MNAERQRSRVRSEGVKYSNGTESHRIWKRVGEIWKRVDDWSIATGHCVVEQNATNLETLKNETT